MEKKKRQSTVDVVKRWIAIDLHLSSPLGLGLKDYSTRKGISKRQLQRDLADLKELGLAIQSWDFGPPDPHLFKYAAGQQPLFTANKLKRDARLRADALEKRKKSEGGGV